MRDTIPVRMSRRLHGQLLDMSVHNGCSLTFLIDLAVRQMLKDGLHVGTIRADIEDAYQKALSNVKIVGSTIEPSKVSTPKPAPEPVPKPIPEPDTEDLIEEIAEIVGSTVEPSKVPTPEPKPIPVQSKPEPKSEPIPYDDMDLHSLLDFDL